MIHPKMLNRILSVNELYQVSEKWVQCFHVPPIYIGLVKCDESYPDTIEIDKVDIELKVEGDILFGKCPKCGRIFVRKMER